MGDARECMSVSFSVCGIALLAQDRVVVLDEAKEEAGGRQTMRGPLRLSNHQ